MASTLRTAARIAMGRAAAPATRATEFLGTFSSVGAMLGGTIELSEGERSFSSSAVAYRCVAFIAQNLAAVDMLVMAGEEADENDPIAVLWNRGTPDAPYSARVVRELAFARAELHGESFTFLDRGDTGTGPVLGLHPIFDPVEVLTEKVGRGLLERVTGFIVRRGGARIPLLPSEVLWLRYPHPQKRWGALAPWKAALYAHETDAYARAWQRGEFKNAARPSMLVHLGDLDQQAHDSAVAAYNSRVAGPHNAGKSLLVSGPGKANAVPLQLTPQEMSFLETRTASAEEVMLAFGLRKDVLYGESTFENQRAAKTAAWTETLLPKLDTAGSEIDRQVVPDPGRTVAWDLSAIDALRESVDALYTRAAEAMVPDLLLVDEGRAMLDLEPLPGGMGQYTLTDYRARVAAEVQAAYLAPLPTGGSSQLAAVPPRLVRLGGRTRLLRTTPPVDVRAQRRAQTFTSWQRVYDRHERVGRRAVARLAERQEKDVLRKLRELTRSGQLAEDVATRWATYAATSPAQAQLLGAPAEVTATVAVPGQRMAADDLLSASYWTTETRKALEDFMTGAWLEGGQRTTDTFGLSFDLFDNRVLDAMGDRLDVLAQQITDTTRAVLDSQLLQHGAAAGESVDDLARRLRGVFTDLTTWRAQLIARTEVVGGMNAAAHTVATASGLVVSREWLATKDGRTRPSHAHQDGYRVQGTDAAYPNGCRYPGDPAAPPSETVACRCVELFETA